MLSFLQENWNLIEKHLDKDKNVKTERERKTKEFVRPIANIWAINADFLVHSSATVLAIYGHDRIYE